MRRKLIGLGLAILAFTTLTGVGCFQIHKFVSVAMGNLSAVNASPSAGYYVNLAVESSTYRDHRDKFDDISDCAVLGRFENNLASGVSAEMWIVTNPSGPILLPDLAAVQAAGGIRLWSMSLGPNETRNIDWNTSSGLFTKAGKDALVGEIEEDGEFTLYVFGSTGTYDITVTNATFVVVISVSEFF